MYINGLKENVRSWVEGWVAFDPTISYEKVKSVALRACTFRSEESRKPKSGESLSNVRNRQCRYCKKTRHVQSELRKRLSIAILEIYGYNVMPFGLVSAASTCQRHMGSILQECKEFTRVYIDNAIILSESTENTQGASGNRVRNLSETEYEIEPEEVPFRQK